MLFVFKASEKATVEDRQRRERELAAQLEKEHDEKRRLQIEQDRQENERREKQR